MEISRTINVFFAIKSITNRSSRYRSGNNLALFHWAVEKMVQRPAVETLYLEQDSSPHVHFSPFSFD